MKFTIKLAEINIEVNCLYSFTKDMCFNFIVDEPADFSVTINQKDIEAEQDANFSDEYLESLAVYRKICTELVKYDAFLLHGSAIAYNNKAFIFTGRSGIGKSTHSAFLKELLKEKVQFINDDKPIIRIKNEIPYVYGTPWNGKHKRSSNISFPLNAIGLINQADQNSVIPADDFSFVIRQVYRPDDTYLYAKTLELIDLMLKVAKLYKIDCTNDISAAKLSYEKVLNA